MTPSHHRLPAILSAFALASASAAAAAAAAVASVPQHVSVQNLLMQQRMPSANVDLQSDLRVPPNRRAPGSLHGASTSTGISCAARPTGTPSGLVQCNPTDATVPFEQQAAPEAT